MSDIKRETANEALFGAVTVGQTAVQVNPFNLPDRNMKGIVLKAPGSGDSSPNSAPVWVGKAGVSTSAGGFPIAPGESLSLPLEDSSILWAISSSNSQHLYFVLI